MVEVEKEWASKGVSGAALGTGIAGLSLGVLNALGGLGGVTLGMQRNNCGCNTMPMCNEAMPVTRYDLGREQEIATKDARIALLESTIHTDQKSLELYSYIDGQLKDIRATLCNQAVHNQRTEDSFALARQDIAAVRADLSREIQIEAERRCCGDNSIVTYANATFYPKMVADVTTGTTTTAPALYTPRPKCGCDCR